MAPERLRFVDLPAGAGTALIGSLGDPDLVAAGYEQRELGVVATVHAVTSADATFPEDGRFELAAGAEAEVRTRVVARRPVDPARCSGTVVLEWLNVSSGSDAAPSYGFLGAEVVRRGHVWVGLSAQKAGIETAPALVRIGDGAIRLEALRQTDPERYGGLHHPGDEFSYDLYTCVARALRSSRADGPTADLGVERVLAVGESQSAYTLTTYANGVHPTEHAVDGFLIHSRGGPAAPLGGPDGRIDLEDGRGDEAVRIRDDLDVPVVVVETETDLLGHLRYLPARQPDTDGFRLWEIAGTAHADRSLIGDFEPVLGCPEPVNRGQQGFVVRAALRRLEEWVVHGTPPPAAPRLAVVDDGAGRGRFDVDDLGNVLGGVRTPCVDAPVELLSGLAPAGANRACQLFGRTAELPEATLRERYGSRDDYVAAYTAAADAAIAAGFVLAEDRGALLADARTDRITW